MKDSLFLDTNVVIDLLGQREPYYESAARIVTLADKGMVRITVSALTYPTAYNILCKFVSKDVVKEKIRLFKTIAATAELTDPVINMSLSSKFADFEDALQYFGALQAGCTTLITRNVMDFAASELPVLTPDEYLSSLKNQS